MFTSGNFEKLKEVCGSELMYLFHNLKVNPNIESKAKFPW